MNKIWWTIKGYISCFGWMFGALWELFLEHFSEFRFWKRYETLDDHIWYAERVNGRLAMIVLTTVLILELVSHKSIWDLINELQLNSLLLRL